MRREDLVIIAIDMAWKHYGLPYVWGGDDPIRGYDCSGFVVEILQSVGILPHGFDLTAHGLYKRFPVCAPLPGALAIFGTSKHATHVGIVIANLGDRVLMLEAGGGGATTTDRQSAAIQNAYVKLRPVARRSDHVCYVDPYSEE